MGNHRIESPIQQVHKPSTDSTTPRQLAEVQYSKSAVFVSRLAGAAVATLEAASIRCLDYQFVYLSMLPASTVIVSA